MFQGKKVSEGQSDIITDRPSLLFQYFAFSLQNDLKDNFL